jgi:hypothetical protein
MMVKSGIADYHDQIAVMRREKRAESSELRSYSVEVSQALVARLTRVRFTVGSRWIFLLLTHPHCLPTKCVR